MSAGVLSCNSPHTLRELVCKRVTRRTGSAAAIFDVLAMLPIFASSGFAWAIVGPSLLVLPRHRSCNCQDMVVLIRQSEAYPAIHLQITASHLLITNDPFHVPKVLGKACLLLIARATPYSVTRLGLRSRPPLPTLFRWPEMIPVTTFGHFGTRP